MAKDINEKPFDEATKLKLKIFGETFQEWFPVFIHDNYTKKVYIYDFLQEVERILMVILVALLFY